MTKFTKILPALLLTAAVAYAGGAAALAAKKSNSKGYTFTPATQYAFMTDCGKDANRQVCGCVLAKLQMQYSEKAYLQMDGDLQKGIENPDFVKFITEAVEGCDSLYANAVPCENAGPNANAAPNAKTGANARPSDESPTFAAGLKEELGEPSYEKVAEPSKGVSEAEAKAYVEKLQKDYPKKVFVSNCNTRSKDYLGEKASNKICGCAYDRISAHLPEITKRIQEDGYPEIDDYSVWAMDYAMDCIPDKFTPDVEKAMIGYLNEQGIPKSMGQCFIKTLKKEFTLKSFLMAAFNNKEGMLGIITTLLARCVLN